MSRLIIISPVVFTPKLLLPRRHSISGPESFDPYPTILAGLCLERSTLGIVTRAIIFDVGLAVSLVIARAYVGAQPKPRPAEKGWQTELLIVLLYVATAFLGFNLLALALTCPPDEVFGYATTIVDSVFLFIPAVTLVVVGRTRVFTLAARHFDNLNRKLAAGALLAQLTTQAIAPAEWYWAKRRSPPRVDRGASARGAAGTGAASIAPPRAKRVPSSEPPGLPPATRPSYYSS